jgi:hypothetical protein
MSLLNRLFHYLNAYKILFSKPIDSNYDIILLGGAFGSMFSFLQVKASPLLDASQTNMADVGLCFFLWQATF